MECFIYQNTSEGENELTQQECIQYAKSIASLPKATCIEDPELTKSHWHQREIGLLLNNAQPNTCIIVYEAPQLACSTSQVLDILTVAARRRVHLHFVKYGMIIENNDTVVNTQHLLNVVARIESNFISKRTSQALARRKAAGLPLGRPKGRGNRSLKLDKHREDILRYLELNISKASIAKLVCCHPQTLYDWLERNNIDSLPDSA